MQTAVESVIYFYIFICVALLVFNVLYIFRSVIAARNKTARIRKWEKLLPEDMHIPEQLGRKLRHTEDLIACQEVISGRLGDSPEAHKHFVQENRVLIRQLALAYKRKQAMERAYFAYAVRRWYSPSGERDPQLAELMLSCFENSTVYCRENLLHALYALGGEQAVEHAFELLQENNWYHSPKLIADGLITFTGDQPALAKRLWRRHEEWAECILVGIIQFITALPGDDFSQEFLTALERTQTDLGARFALVRYFQRHPSREALPVLMSLLEEEDEEENHLGIAAAAALQSYPESRYALRKALSSRNWYVRRNAAGALNRIGLEPEDVEAVRDSGDRYAMEMLEYVTGKDLFSGVSA